MSGCDFMRWMLDMLFVAVFSQEITQQYSKTSRTMVSREVELTYYSICVKQTWKTELYLSLDTDGKHIGNQRFEAIVTAAKNAVNHRPFNRVSDTFQFSWSKSRGRGFMAGGRPLIHADEVGSLPSQDSESDIEFNFKARGEAEEIFGSETLARHVPESWHERAAIAMS